MGMKGSLRDMSAADLIQHNCQDRKTAELCIQNSLGVAFIYFKDGNIVHASMGEKNGEEVVYQLLGWNDGTFTVEVDVEPPARTISRSWSSLLLEGSQRLDETRSESIGSQSEINLEVAKMAKLDDVLKEMSGEVTGYVASAIVGIDGINVASYSKVKGVDPDAISSQMTMLLKLVDGSLEKLACGTLDDNLTTTDAAYLLMRFLPGNKQFYLGMAADRKTGNLGNMRLICKMFTERISKLMPR